MKSETLIGLAAVLLLSSAVARADVEISSKPTANMSCDAGVCTATAQKAVLNVSDLANMLASGDVAVQTGTLAKDIDIDQPLTWSSTTRLTLDAQQSVTVKKPVTIAGTAGLTLTTNDGGSGGDLLFENKGSVTFWDTSSSLVINGQSYTLVKDIATLAADIAANPSGAYALANSYDAKHVKFDTVPIPTSFSGTLEGLGQTISHLKIRHHLKTLEGFFAYVDVNGAVRDLNLMKMDSRSSNAKVSVGSLAGESLGYISHVAASGTVQGAAFRMGGIVGDNEGRIDNVSSSVNIAGTTSLAGGIAGYSAPSGYVMKSHASGNVSGENAGGLVGSGSNIMLSYATGAVKAGDYGTVGGLAAGGDTIDQSFATGSVTGGDNGAIAGGLVGVGSFISNSYATGSVQIGSHLIGGLVGYAGDVTTSYSTGMVTAGKRSYIGGLLGRGDRHSALDYWDIDTSGTSVGCGKGDCAGVTGLTTEQLRSQLPAGLDPKIWGQADIINGGLPYLRANQPPN